VAAVHPELKGQRQVGVGDPAQCPQHPPLVVLAGMRHAGAQEELAAVAVDVGREEGHALVCEDGLERGERRSERLGDRVRTLLVQQRVGSGEANEGDAGDAVLRLGWTRLEHPAERAGEETAQGLALDLALGKRLPGPGVRPPPAQQQGVVVARPGGRGGQRCGGRRAHGDLAGVRCALGRRHLADVPPDQDELPVQRSHEEEVDRSRVQADRHREPQAAHGRRLLCGLAKRTAHLHRGARGAHGVTLTVKQEEERIPPELEQHAAALAGALEHGAEDPAEGLDQLLAAHPPPSRESLRERREARDVREAQRPVDRAPPALRFVDCPVDCDLRDVPAKAAHSIQTCPDRTLPRA